MAILVQIQSVLFWDVRESYRQGMTFKMDLERRCIYKANSKGGKPDKCLKGML